MAQRHAPPMREPPGEPPQGRPARPGPIVFAHANSFPAGTYRMLFDSWRAAGYDVVAPEKLGHHPSFAVTNNWPHLRDELIDAIEAQCTEPAFLVGHSLGGYLSMLAAARRPDLAMGVVLLDAPILSGWKAQALRLAKATGLAPRYSPGAVSRRRRVQWPSQQAAFDHFVDKPAFAAWEPSVLRDYVAAGTEPFPADGATPAGRRLTFRREIETAIYDTLPHDLGPLLKSRPLACPLAFIGGTRSDEVRRVGMTTTKRVARGRITWIEGSHLFPMERPTETATAVLTHLRGFDAEHASRGFGAWAAGGFGPPPSSDFGLL